jgi:hypothetical protein
MHFSFDNGYAAAVLPGPASYMSGVTAKARIIDAAKGA